MYFEEQIIHGTLCYRMTPNGPWTQYSKEELSRKLLVERERFQELAWRLESLEK